MAMNTRRLAREVSPMSWALLWACATTSLNPPLPKEEAPVSAPKAVEAAPPEPGARGEDDERSPEEPAVALLRQHASFHFDREGRVSVEVRNG